jgi:hypothetical protein
MAKLHVELRRRTNSPSVADLRPLDENEFWLQTQGVMSSFLLNSSYGPNLYVPVSVAREKELSEELRDFVGLDSADPNCLLLVGQYGVGKTSSIKHFFSDFLPNCDELKGDRRCVYFDGNKHSTELGFEPSLLMSCLSSAIAVDAAKFLDEEGLTRESLLDDCFRYDRVFAAQRLLLGMETEARFEIVKKVLERPIYVLEITLRYLTRNFGEGRVVLILDNLDPLKKEIQLDAIRLAQGLAVSCGVRCIISIRNVTDSRLSYGDPSTMRNIVRTYVPPPPMTEVIRMRIDQALASPEAQSATLGKGAIRAKLSECPEFAEVLVKGLSSVNVQRLLEGLSNGSVREALQFSVRVYNSHFLDSFRIIRKITPADAVAPSLWHGYLPYYMVLKALLLSNFPIYRPDRSWVGNAFGTTYSDSHLGPFLRIHILLYAQRYYPDDVPLQNLIDQIASILDAERDIIDIELKWLDHVGWIEIVDPEHIATSVRGRFVANNLLNDVEYLTHISTDVDMYPEMESQLIAPAEQARSRLSNLVVLLEYLVDRERKMIHRISGEGAHKYVKVFGSKGMVKAMAEGVLKSLRLTDLDHASDGAFQEDIFTTTRVALEKIIKRADLSSLFDIFGGNKNA